MRYQIREGSLSCHCCFEFTIIDTETPTLFNGESMFSKERGELYYDTVCECFTKEDAELICNALNKKEK